MSHLYGVLGVPKDAGNAQVKAAYRNLAKAYHPDLGGGSERRFREVCCAYETLGDAARRAAYDAQDARARAMARRRLRSALATTAASFMLTVGSGMFVAGLLLGV